MAEFARLSSENSQLREAMAKMKEENEKLRKVLHVIGYKTQVL